MAAQFNKRRKLEHTPLEEDDDASFASFGDSDDEVAELGGDAGEAEDVDITGFSEESDVEDSDDVAGVGTEEDDVDDAVTQVGAQGAGGPTATQQSARRSEGAKTRRAVMDAGGGASMVGTFKSNIFSLQVDGLLEQIRPRRGKREEAAEQALHALKKTMDQAPTRDPLPVEEAERDLLTSSKVATPFPEPRPPRHAMYKLEFAKPSNVNVVGSHALKTGTRGRDVLTIDMVVTMPSSLFQEKDYLNYCYFYKRAYYLACLAASIQSEHALGFDLHFEGFHEDELKPILVVGPKQTSSNRDAAKSKPKWRINIIPSIGADVFLTEKLFLQKNSIRSAGETKPEPTPFYNSSLRADMLMSSYLKLMHHAASTCDGFRDACLLGSTWLRQRGFGTGTNDGGFGHCEWSTLMALLLHGGGPNGKPILSEGYSSYQLFKSTLQVLAMRDLSRSGLIVGSGDVKSMGNGSPLLWDGARVHNVLYKVTPWAYSQLIQDARTTLTTLGDQLFDGFEATYIMRTDSPLLRYDYLVNAPASAIFTKAGSYQKLYDVLKRGLGDRVTLMTIKLPPTASWRLGSARSKLPSNASVSVGLSVNPETVSRTVDHGPPAESKAEAASFRKFWGEKAELRRFKDGSITESLVWSANDGGKTVLEQIARFLLLRHFGEDAEQGATLVGHGFSCLLRHGAGMAAYQPLMEAYKQLETDIRGLEGLPLSIRQLMPADSQLRYSSVRPPIDVGGRQQAMPANVTIQFEGSARWPDDVVAIQRTKIAFLLKQNELLQAAKENVTARIGLENHDHDSLNEGYLDIVYESGAAFRMRIHHDREQTLLERQLKDKSFGPSAKEAAATRLAAYKREYIRAPTHTQAIARLCSRYTALSGTIRSLKKWFASHLLANHIADEVVELIVVRTFVQPWPWQTPSSVQTGFLRTLHWLARWDWRAEPLVVDLSGSGELKLADTQAIRTRFEAWRKLDPSLNRIVLFAASNVDHDGTTWTDGHPQRVVAGRMTALAKAASAEVEEKQMALEPASLFASPLTDYDFVLHLDPSLTGGQKRKGARNGTTYKNLELATLDDETTVGFNAVQLFLQELQTQYGSAILFFSGGSERPIIAGLWSPQTALRSWKMNLAYSTRPRKVSKGKSEDAEVWAEINKEGILAEMASLGGELIERVEVKGRCIGA